MDLLNCKKGRFLSKNLDEKDYNRKHGAKTLKTFKIGNLVRVKTDHEKPWNIIGIITIVYHQNRRYSIQTSSRIICRNRQPIDSVGDT